MEHAHLQRLWACPAAGYLRRGTVYLSLFDITRIEASDVDVLVAIMGKRGIDVCAVMPAPARSTACPTSC